MSRHETAETLRQILAFCSEARGYTEGHSREQFGTDRKLQLTIERLIELIGEASSRLPEDFRARHQEVPWAKIIGMRNRINHGYDALDYDILWSVVEHELESLAHQVEAILSRKISA